jgi:muconate cycloisomerase
MHIRQLTLLIARLPLKLRFTHATATRDESENVFVCCELADGTVGWGEGVPRSYVTGETPTGCLQQLAATPVAEQLAADCNSWPDVIGLCERFQPAEVRDNPRGCYGNALRCAVELSILDAFGRKFGEPVTAVTRHFEPAAAIRAANTVMHYSAVIDAEARRLRLKSLVRRLYGFRDCKVKVGREGDDDAGRLGTIRRWIGPGVDLRIDVNGGWRAGDAPRKLASFAGSRISCVEQPLAHEEFSALADLRKKASVPMMLDESLTSPLDAEAAVAQNACDLFNIRLSKCGGFLASLRLAAFARAHGLGYQLGCHPGETALLSAAGRHLAGRVEGLRYVEGSYDRHILGANLTHQDVTFRYGGWAQPLEGPGLGVAVDPGALEAMTVESREIRYD